MTSMSIYYQNVKGLRTKGDELLVGTIGCMYDFIALSEIMGVIIKFRMSIEYLGLTEIMRMIPGIEVVVQRLQSQLILGVVVDMTWNCSRSASG